MNPRAGCGHGWVDILDGNKLIMVEYIDWSARDCDAERAAQVIQSSQDVSQSAQQAAASAAEATLVLEEVTTMVNDLHDIIKYL